MSGEATYRVAPAYLVAASILAALPTPVAGQAAKPGCELVDIDIQKFGGAPLLQPQVIQSANGRLDAALEVAYATNEVAGCDVELRSYNGKLAGPTLRAKPGDTLYIRMKNDLPPEPHGHTGDHNIPHGFNSTNLHTHGLHVSPNDNSDNVFRRDVAVSPASLPHPCQPVHGMPEKVWRDTLIVEKGRPERILTRYEDFKGKFVLHCHILDHEDGGMMQAVEIVD